MNVRINKKKCSKCGFCTKFLSSVFSFDSNGDIVVSQVSNEDEDAVKKASILCEANAIDVNKNIKLLEEENEIDINTKKTSKTLNKTNELFEYKKTFSRLISFWKILLVFSIIALIGVGIYVGIKFQLVGVLWVILLGCPLCLLWCLFTYYLVTYIPKFFVIICDSLLDEKKSSNSSNSLNNLETLGKEVVENGKEN